MKPPVRLKQSERQGRFCGKWFSGHTSSHPGTLAPLQRGCAECPSQRWSPFLHPFDSRLVCDRRI